MVDLSPSDREYCRDITLQVLDRTLHDYADTASWSSGCSSSRSSDVEHDGWTKLRSHGNVSMYAERTTDLAWVMAMRGRCWSHPVSVVSVGRMCCSLNDALYGMVAYDPAEFKLRAVLTNRAVEDDVEVETITTPSEGEPFQFMGVTRYVTGSGCLHRPQEYVLVTATGEVSTSCGEHLGYEINQSVSVTRWPVTSSTTRKQVIQARLLRELADGSVGVYYKIIVDSTGLLPDSVVQSSLWHDVQDFWKMTPRCADAKKLCYCVEHSDVLNLSAPRRWGDPFTCGVCGSSTLKGRRSSLGDIASALVHGVTRSFTIQEYRCALCSSYLCSKSRCCSIRQLVRIDRKTLETNRRTIALCTSCADVVRSKDATEIARRGLQEIHATFKDEPAPYAGSCAKHQAQPPKKS